MAALRFLIFMAFVSGSNAVHVEPEPDKNSCLMQLITKYMDHKKVFLYRWHEKIDFDFPFDKDIAFVVDTGALGPVITFDNSKFETSEVILYIDDVNKILKTLEFIWSNLLWNFKRRHLILINQITLASTIEKLVTKMQWQGFMSYNVVIGFYDESKILHFFVWFPSKSEQDCGDRKELEYIGPCNTIDSDPFARGVYKKLRQCPLKLSIDVTAMPVTTYVDTHIINTFTEMEGIAGR